MLRRWKPTRSSRLTYAVLARARMDASLHAKPAVRVFKIDKERAWDKQSMVGRVYLCAACFVAGFFVIGLRMADIAFPREPKTFPDRAVFEPLRLGDGVGGRLGGAENITRTPEVFPAKDRPLILDRNGVTLAMNKKVTSVEIETRHVWDAKETAQKLAEVLPGIDISRLTLRIKEKKNVVVKPALDQDEIEAVMMLGLPGVHFTNTYERAYPQGALGAHLIGYTVPGRGGAMGLEKTMDGLASGWWRGKDSLFKTPATAQAGIPAGRYTDAFATSVDFVAQQILEEELAQTRHGFQAKAAWGIVMDVRNGAVIAMASQPGFNPNATSSSPVHHLRNRAMYDRYELGSAFKAITAAAALEVGVTDIYQYYDVSQPIRISDKIIGDFYKKYGQMQLPRILQTSSNIGIAHIARALGTTRQRQFFKELGLLEPLLTDLPEKRAPNYPLNWGPVETATIAYGHGISVTALQLIAAFAAVVNDGCYHVPYFVKENHSGDTSPPPSSEGKLPCHQVFSPYTTAHMRLMLRKVVTEGTAKAANVPGYYPIGKTATADKSSSTGGYQENTRISSFVGAFPGYNPQYVLLVSFDEPQDQTSGPAATGSVVAAPAFSRIVSRLAPSLGLRPVTDDIAFAGFVAPLSKHQVPDGSFEGVKTSDMSLAKVDTYDDALARLLRGINP